MTAGHASMHTGGDLDWALGMYGLFARGGDDERTVYAEILGEPWSKARPRFSRKSGKPYQLAADAKAEDGMRKALSRWATKPFLGNVMLVCRFYRSDFQRIDTDNLLKHVCDSANKLWWHDDSQVTLLLGEALHDPVHPRTIVLAGNHASTLRRGDDRKRACEHCGESYLPAAGERMRVQRFCSQACGHAARAVVLTPIPCPVCGSDFQPTTKAQQMCSPECRAEKLRGRNRGRGKPLSVCSSCGKQLAHYRGGRCRVCWLAAPGVYPEQMPLDEEASR